MSDRKKAVALRYDRDVNKAPEVIAKGEGYIAEKIIEKAKEYGIEIKEDKELVSLLSQIDINREIPSELYKAVAEILIFIYRKKKKFFTGE
ncbi:EscU/YscU/HrcU family type III secretion system export apparatus switch protein [Persephonella sp.]